MLSIGIWVAVSGDSFKTIVADNPIIFNAVYIIIAVGAALFIIGFIGCCGAVKENRCLLGTVSGSIKVKSRQSKQEVFRIYTVDLPPT